MYELPDESLVFTPDPDGAPSVVMEPVRIHLSLTRDYYICDGVYATLYEATISSKEDPRVSTRVAFKVFKGSDDETRRLAEEEYTVLRDLDGLDGHAPRACAFGVASRVGRAAGGRPTIAQEFLTGTSVYEAFRQSGVDPSSEAHILDVLQRSWAIALATNQVVSHGVRHGDLSYTNVLLSRADHPNALGQEYFAMVIDFGQAAVKRDIGSYDKLGTDFFSAPELLAGDSSFDANRGRASADLYSIGALTLYMLLRPSFDDDERFFGAVQGNDARLEEVLGDWLSGRDDESGLAEMLALVIRCCMCEEPADRLAMTDVIETLEALCTPERRTREQLEELRKWLLHRGAAGRYSFMRLMEQRFRIRPSARIFGRDNELDQITEKLRDGRTAYVRGFGGIGKTTLGLSFAAQAIGGADCHDLGIKRAYLISAEDGLVKQLANIGSSIAPLSDDSRHAEEGKTLHFAELALQAMEEGLQGDSLVIFDGLPEAAGHADGSDELLERMAGNGAYRLVVTSRRVPTGLLRESEVVISGMDDESLDRVFANQLHVAPYDPSLLPRLYRAVGRNTLAVKIVGGLIEQSGGMLSLVEVLETLESGNLGNDLIDEYEVRLGGKQGTDTIRGHMHKLLSLAGFDSDELRLLSMLLLIPGSGILLSTLREGLRRYEPSLGKVYGSLQSRGWIETMPEEGLVYLHPLVRDVCLESDYVLPPSVTSRGLIEVMYDNARWHLNQGDLSYMFDFEAILTVAEPLFYDEVSDPVMERVFQLHAEVVHTLGMARREVKVLELLIELLEQTAGEQPTPGGPQALTMADALYHLCIAQNDVGRHADAVQSASRALRLLGWATGPTDGSDKGAAIESADNLALIASLLAARGYASHDLWEYVGHNEEDYRSALIDKETALQIIRTIGGDSWQVAGVLYTLAYSEFWSEETKEQALADEEEAVVLLKSSHHKPNYERELLLATAQNFLGYFLCGPDGVYDRARLEESLERKEEAIQIRYRYLDPYHRDIARSHNNIALTLKEMGDLEGALGHALTALKIHEARLGSAARRGNLTYNNVLDLQKRLNLTDEELEARLEALEVPESYVR